MIYPNNFDGSSYLSQCQDFFPQASSRQSASLAMTLRHGFILRRAQYKLSSP